MLSSVQQDLLVRVNRQTTATCFRHVRCAVDDGHQAQGMKFSLLFVFVLVYVDFEEY